MDLSNSIEVLVTKGKTHHHAWRVCRLAQDDTLAQLVGGAKALASPSEDLVAVLGLCPSRDPDAVMDAADLLVGYLGAKVDPMACLAALAHRGNLRSPSRLAEWVRSARQSLSALATVAIARSSGDEAEAELLWALEHGWSTPVADTSIPDGLTWEWLHRRVGGLLPRTDDAPMSLRELAAWALGQAASTKATATLERTLTAWSTTPELARTAMGALADIDPNGIVERAVGWSHHKRPVARYAAVWCLGRLAAREQQDLLRQRVADRNWRVALEAEVSLSRAGLPGGTTQIMKCARRRFGSKEVRMAAFRAAAELALPDGWPIIASQAISSSIWESPSSPRRLSFLATQILRDNTPEVLADTIQKHKIGPKRILKLLDVMFKCETPGAHAAARNLVAASGKDLLRHLERKAEGSWLTRANTEAVRALRAAGRYADTQAWVKRLDSPSDDIKEIAAYVLRDSGDAGMESVLLARMAERFEPERLPRGLTLDALASADSSLKLGPLVREHVERLRSDKQTLEATRLEKEYGTFVRRRLLAAIALSGCGTPAAFEALKAWVKGSDWELLMAGALALVEIGTRFVAESTDAGLPELLQGTWPVASPSARASLAGFFALTKHRAIVPQLILDLQRTYGDGPFAIHRVVLLDALSQLGDPSAADVMLELAQGDPNPGVQHAAMEAYAALTGDDPRQVASDADGAAQRVRDRVLRLLDEEAGSITKVRASSFSPSSVHCCVACGSTPTKSEKMTGSHATGNMISTYQVWVPTCEHCSVANWDVPAGLIWEDGWMIQFLNVSLAEMHRDSRRLATASFPSAAVLFT